MDLNFAHLQGDSLHLISWSQGEKKEEYYLKEELSTLPVDLLILGDGVQDDLQYLNYPLLRNVNIDQLNYEQAYQLYHQENKQWVLNNNLLLINHFKEEIRRLHQEMAQDRQRAFFALRTLIKKNIACQRVILYFQIINENNDQLLVNILEESSTLADSAETAFFKDITEQGEGLIVHHQELTVVKRTESGPLLILIFLQDGATILSKSLINMLTDFL